MSYLEQLFAASRERFDAQKVDPHDSESATDAYRAWTYSVYMLLSPERTVVKGAEVPQQASLEERERIALELFSEILADQGLKKEITWWVSESGASDFPGYVAETLCEIRVSDPIVERLKATIPNYDRIMAERWASIAA